MSRNNSLRLGLRSGQQLRIYVKSRDKSSFTSNIFAKILPSPSPSPLLLNCAGTSAWTLSLGACCLVGPSQKIVWVRFPPSIFHPPPNCKFFFNFEDLRNPQFIGLLWGVMGHFGPLWPLVGHSMIFSG
jgi:hypothetical protein